MILIQKAIIHRILTRTIGSSPSEIERASTHCSTLPLWHLRHLQLRRYAVQDSRDPPPWPNRRTPKPSPIPNDRLSPSSHLLVGFPWSGFGKDENSVNKGPILLINDGMRATRSWYRDRCGVRNVSLAMTRRRRRQNHFARLQSTEEIPSQVDRLAYDIWHCCLQAKFPSGIGLDPDKTIQPCLDVDIVAEVERGRLTPWPRISPSDDITKEPLVGDVHWSFTNLTLSRTTGLIESFGGGCVYRTLLTVAWKPWRRNMNEILVNIAGVTVEESCEYSRSDIHVEFILADCVSLNVEYLITARREADATSASAPIISPKTGMNNSLAWLKDKFTVTLNRTPNKRASAAIDVS